MSKIVNPNFKNGFTAIIQARLGSTRLPHKVIKKVYGDMTLLEFLCLRLKQSKYVNEFFIATTDQKEDDLIEEIARKLGFLVIRGEVRDVLSRFILVSQNSQNDAFIRITGDCPLFDPSLLDNAIELFSNKDIDYLSNIDPPTYPDGLDLEIFTKNTLVSADNFCEDIKEREHVTPWIRGCQNIKKFNLQNTSDFSNLRWTVDEEEDFILIKNIVKNFQGRTNFSWEDVLKLYKKEPNLFLINKMFKRNEGSKLTSGQKFWRKAKKIIPGGNMLLSKRPEMFLPEKWPTYYSEAKGYKIHDLDKNLYIDMSIMGIGTNLLGYANDEVDKAVHECIRKSNMSTLNCPEEVLLAEKLIELHPWAEMVRFARTGGEANAIAIRIARAATGRDKVAICGYHGWHDWYLSTNLSNNSGLEEHLLPGLNPLGVPKSLKGTVLPFSYNNLDQLKRIVNDNDLAAIKMEVQRNVPPKKNFLEEIRRLCTQNGIVLIFDECTSGFRETFGGLHLKYKIEPDISIFGKALGNGYPITSVIGKKNVMESAQDTFISSTFWTDRIGPTAALKTLEIMEDQKSWEKVSLIGSRMKNGWLSLAKNNNVDIKIFGLDALASFVFDSQDGTKYKTLISQEMLKLGFLGSTIFYASIVHDEKIVDEYLSLLNDVFDKIALCENGKLFIDDILEGPVCHNTFKRLN